MILPYFNRLTFFGLEYSAPEIRKPQGQFDRARESQKDFEFNEALEAAECRDVLGCDIRQYDL